jgi:hypothetical protein
MNQKPKTEEEVALDKYHDLKALADIPGGKILVEALLTDSVSKVDTLMSQYQSLSHIEMIALCASIKEKMDIVRALTRAESNLKELSDALQT